MKVLSQYGGYHASRKFVYQAIALFDRDGSGEISFREFVEMMTQKPCMKDTVDDIERVFEN
jgi:Ca2+-binding EF-hand superfamily protein